MLRPRSRVRVVRCLMLPIADGCKRAGTLGDCDVREIVFVGDGRNGRSLVELCVSSSDGPRVTSLPMPDWMNETVEIDIARDLGTQLRTVAQAFAHIDVELDQSLQSKGVLLACNKGHNRSPALALAFLMVHCGLSLRAAYRRVLRERPGIDPLPNYRTALVRHESTLLGKSTVSGESFALHISELLRRTGDDYDRAIENRLSSVAALIAEPEDGEVLPTFGTLCIATTRSSSRFTGDPGSENGVSLGGHLEF